MTKVRELLSSKYVFRDAGTGRFVSRLYAILHKSTTYGVRRRHYIEPLE
ncbi:MAG TPA: hypothetical protein VFS91_00075 [Nitrobacter sp.]|nr:hypothetical protein [Nitrobacter sp.]